MGGDHGPGVTVPGALAALRAEADLRIVLVGLSEPITRLINEAPAGLRSRVTVHEATQVVTMDEKPQDALRRKELHRLDLAFSRDQADKVYVQHRLRERGAELYDWLQNGAHLYVCGAIAMGKDVHAALLDIVATHNGGFFYDSATAREIVLQTEKML